MESSEEILQTSGLTNWVKAFIAMRLTKDGLEPFVQDDIKQYVKELLQSIYSEGKVEVDTLCNSCTTFNILPCRTNGFCDKSNHCQVHDDANPKRKPVITCPNGICHRIREAVNDSHTYSSPTWSNTDATGWCTSVNEIAKCYIAKGYRDKQHLDLNAIMSVIANRKSFGPKMEAKVNSKNEDENIIKKVLKMGNQIRHSANLNISDTELTDYINELVNILSDSKSLTRNENAIKAVSQLKKLLLKKTLVISEKQGQEALGDVVDALDSNGKNDIKDSATKLVSLDNQVSFAGTELKEGKTNDSTNTSSTDITSAPDTGKNNPKTSEVKVLSTKEDPTAQVSENVSDASTGEDTEVLSTKNESKKEIKATNDAGIQISDVIPNTEASSSKETENGTRNGTNGKTTYNQPHSGEEIKKQKLVKIFKDMKNELAGRGNVPISDIDTILEVKLNALEEIRKAKEDGVLEFKREIEAIEIEKRLERGSQKLPRGTYRELRQDLSKFYRSRYSTIVISPLIAAHDVPLVDLYVQPKLQYVDVTNTLEGAPADLRIHSYQDLFFCESSSYKDIYVTAKAGIGKTSFAKRICMTWCQAHFPLKHLEKSFDERDLGTLKMFDVLFMIPLKETNSDDCNIDEMILHLDGNRLFSKRRYTESFLDDILRNKRVLVILDGLDEWAHPEKCPQKSEVIPHRRTSSNCSVLTTTRPWKLASAKLRNSQINMHAELLEFDKASSNKLVVSAVNLLNKTYKKAKSDEDFSKEVSLELLGALQFIPYILLQVICLWYDDQSIGKSQCEIYSNALELTFSRGGHTEDTMEVRSDTTPKCLSQNKTCRNHYSMLLNVGKLAFEALYSNTNESTLLFDEDIVKQYIAEKELHYILQKGLLSQNKDSSKVSCWKTYFSFQHKSIQEYFAALYIQAAFEGNEDISDKIDQSHISLESVLQMSNVFIFLGGFNPDICGRLLQKLKGILSSDDVCLQYRKFLSGRTSSPEKRKCWEIVKSFQNMQIDILQEVSRNEAGECHLYLEDLVLDDSIKTNMLNLLEGLVKENKDKLTSVSIEQCPSDEDLANKLEMFQLQSSTNLQKLDITAVPSEKDLRCLLFNSEKTLVSLDVCFAVYKNKKYSTVYTKLSTETISTVFRMANLQSVRLNSIILEHNDVENLVKHINEKKTLTEVGLCHIRCVKHEACVMLDLTEHINLETLRIGTIPVICLKLNGSSLKFCYTGELTRAVHVELIQKLPGAVNLKTLRLKFLDIDQSSLYTSEALARMDQLKSFAFEKADFGQNELIIPSEMLNLERVQFYQVKMTALTLKKFIESVSSLHQPVLVIIDDCDIASSPGKFWMTSSYDSIKSTIRKKFQHYRVLFDRGNTFSFITKK